MTISEAIDIMFRHAGNSIHERRLWAHSSAGRAPALQAGGHRFEPYNAHHHCGLVVQLVRMPACHAGGRRFEPVPGRHRFLDTISKQYIMCWRGSTVEQLIYPSQSYNRDLLLGYKWRHSQVVRQRSAKPLFPSSNLGVASNRWGIAKR